MNYIFMITVIAFVLMVLAIASFTNFKLDNEHYDRLKWIVVRWSYLVFFIGVVVKTFNMPYGTETVTLIAALGATLAGMMGISNKNYQGEKMDRVLNEDLLKDMLGFNEDMHIMGEIESEETEEEVESED